MRGYLGGLAVVLTVAAQPSQDAAPQPFRTGVDVVHVDVSVLGANRQPVRGLAATDFNQWGFASRASRAFLAITGCVSRCYGTSIANGTMSVPQ